MDEWIVLGIIVLIALPIMTIAAFVMSLGSRRRIRALESRLAVLERRPPSPLVAAVPESPPSTIPEGAPQIAGDAPPKPEDTAPSELVAPVDPVAHTLPERPRESLEQKLGARWAVWVGGLALALGAIFLVRFSIEAGLLGPGVRIALARFSRWFCWCWANGCAARTA